MKTLKRTAFALAAVTALTSLFSLAACGEAQKKSDHPFRVDVLQQSAGFRLQTDHQRI